MALLRASWPTSGEAAELARLPRLPRQLAREIAEDTVARCGDGRYEAPDGAVELPIARAVELTRLHAAGEDLPPVPARAGRCELSVVRASTLQAAEALTAEGASVCLLNFASAKNPGGGFLSGAVAQEEALARSSGLYPCLLKEEVQAYYRDNKADRSCIYTDHVIVSPAVPVFKRDDGTPLDSPYTVGIVTAPAPNFGVAQRSEEASEIRAARRRRMERVVRLCACGEPDAVVLGAWGCGVFKNDPREVAQEFRALLEGRLRGAFARVVFAVVDQPTCTIFEEVFGFGPPAAERADGAAEGEPSAAAGLQGRAAGAAAAAHGGEEAEERARPPDRAAGTARGGKKGSEKGARKARRWQKGAAHEELL